MMTTAIALVLTLALGVGFCLLAGLERRLDLLAGTSFLVGSTLVVVAMLLLAAIGVGWSPLGILGVAIALAASGLALRRVRSDRDEAEPGDRGFSAADALLAILLLIHAFYVTESAPRDWDYWAIWGLKAKVFFAAGGTFDWAFLRDSTNVFAHPDYPPLLTLLYGWLASWGEVWNDRWFGLLETAMIASLLLIVRGTVNAITHSTRIGAWTALALAFPAMQSRFAIADVPLFTFVTAGLLFLQRDLIDRRNRHAIGGFLLLGGAALTKNEGLTFLGIAIVVHAVLSRSPRRTALLSMLGIVVAAAWQVPRLAVGLSADVTGAGALSRFVDRILDPGWTVTLVRAAPPELTAALIALIITVFIARDRLRSFTFVLIVTLVQLVIYLTVYAGTPYDPAWHVATSWDRISLHLAIPTLVAATTALVECGAPASSRRYGGTPAARS